MKTIKLFFAIASAILTVSACKKDAENTSIVGFWTGTHTHNSQSTNHKQFAALLRNDNTCRFYYYGNAGDTGSSYPAEGTYTIENGTIHSTHVFQAGASFTITGLIGNGLSSIEGTFVTSQPEGPGTFILNKQ